MVKPIIVGISGASGIAYGVRALELLRESGVTQDTWENLLTAVETFVSP